MRCRPVPDGLVHRRHDRLVPDWFGRSGLRERLRLRREPGQSVDSINRYVSERDNAVVSNNSQGSAANNATITLERTLTLVPGRPYTFSFSVASRFANDTAAKSQNQYLQIQTVVGGTATDRLKLTKGENSGTYLGNVVTAGYTPLPALNATKTPAVNNGVRSQTYSFAYSPPAGASSVTLRYVWTLPALGRAPFTADYAGNADIAVSAPPSPAPAADTLGPAPSLRRISRR